MGNLNKTNSCSLTKPPPPPYDFSKLINSLSRAPLFLFYTGQLARCQETVGSATTMSLSRSSPGMQLMVPLSSMLISSPSNTRTLSTVPGCTTPAAIFIPEAVALPTNIHVLLKTPQLASKSSKSCEA